MDYIKIKFCSEFDADEKICDKAIEEMFNIMNPMFSLSERSWKPQMDIYESEDEIIIQAAISGVSKENLEVELSDRAVKIYGMRGGMPPIKNATYRLAEIQHGTFERTLFLPAPIDTEQVSASYTDGFLQVNLVKMKMTGSNLQIDNDADVGS